MHRFRGAHRRGRFHIGAHPDGRAQPCADQELLHRRPALGLVREARTRAGRPGDARSSEDVRRGPHQALHLEEAAAGRSGGGPDPRRRRQELWQGGSRPLRLRGLAVVALAACLVQASCTLGGGGLTEQLAADQTLSFPISNEIGDFDPAQITSPADVDILRNVFSGLYGFDEHLHLVPDIATSFPDISADGLTYTFRLRHDAHFPNGDPLPADDVIFSWNRAAAKQGELAPLFSPIRGYELVAQGRSKQLGGLTKTDAYTVVATLSAAAGYWLTEVGLWPYWIVDQKVVSSAGEDVWFTQPGSLIGSGPFKLTAHAPGQSLDFAPVAHWYGGSTSPPAHAAITVAPPAASPPSDSPTSRFRCVSFCAPHPPR